MTSKKRGVLKTEEAEQIDRMIDAGYSDEEIAKELNRSIRLISKKRVQKPIRVALTETDDSIAELHASPLWRDIQVILFPAEIPYFENSWFNLINQFSEQGIIYSDKLMIRDYILFDIEILRLKKELKSREEIIREMEKRIRAEYKKPDADMLMIQGMNSELNGIRSSRTGIGKRIDDLQTHKEKA